VRVLTLARCYMFFGLCHFLPALLVFHVVVRFLYATFVVQVAAFLARLALCSLGALLLGHSLSVGHAADRVAALALHFCLGGFR